MTDSREIYENCIELDDVYLEFPLHHSGNSTLKEFITKRFSRRLSENEESKTDNASYEEEFRGVTTLIWDSVENADGYRVLIRDDYFDAITDKYETTENKYRFNWDKRDAEHRFRYRIQFTTEISSDWIDLEDYVYLEPPSVKTRTVEVISQVVQSKSKGKSFRALNGISLEVKNGEVLGILGENGSGKSTLLKLIGRIYSPDSGTSKTKGNITLLTSLGSGLERNLTGRENIMVTGTIFGMDQKELEIKIPEIIAFSGIKSEFIDQPLRTYSSGMKSRLGFSIISHLDPDILLLDEVMSAGDYSFRKKSERRILEMVGGRATVVIVSHDIGLLERLCDRVVAMKYGRIVTHGDYEEAVEVYES